MQILERHITLDHSLKGSDHAASLEPIQLKELVRAVRTVEGAMGSFQKHVQEGETPCYEKVLNFELSIEILFKSYIYIYINEVHNCAESFI